MLRKNLAVAFVGCLMAFGASATYGQANFTLLGKDETKRCSVHVEAYWMDWCNYDYQDANEDDHGESSASATATAGLASSHGDANAYGGTNKFAPAKAKVWARGKFNSDAFTFDDMCGYGDAGVLDTYGSSHQWAKFRVNGNGGIGNPHGLPRNWVYVIQGTYDLNISGDQAQWASVKGPGIDLSISSIGGMYGSVTTVTQHGTSHTTVETEEFHGEENPTSKSGTWSAVVTHNQVFTLAAGGSAGMYGEDWAYNYFDQFFSYSGEGKAEIEVTGIVGMPPVQQDDGDYPGGYPGGGYDGGY